MPGRTREDVRGLLQGWRAALESLEQTAEPVAASPSNGIDRLGIRRQAGEIERELQGVYDESFAPTRGSNAERAVLYPAACDALAHLVAGTRAWPDGLLLLGIRNARVRLEGALRQLLGHG